MLPAPCYIFSDAHLDARTPGREHSVASFLTRLRGRAGSVLVNGDLFDFWFEWRRVIPRGHVRVLAALAALCDAGIPVLMIGGNHDCWGGEVLTRDIGIAFQLGAYDGELGGWRAWVEHGDGLRPIEDRTYRRLRHVLRSQLAIRAFRALHPDWASALASGSSGASRAHRARDGGAGLRRIALERLERDPATELVVFGHSHVPALERASTGGVYANPGAWLDAPRYLVVQPARVELRRFDESAEGELLDVADRRV